MERRSPRVRECERPLCQYVACQRFDGSRTTDPNVLVRLRGFRSRVGSCSQQYVEPFDALRPQRSPDSISPSQVGTRGIVWGVCPIPTVSSILADTGSPIAFGFAYSLQGAAVVCTVVGLYQLSGHRAADLRDYLETRPDAVIEVFRHMWSVAARFKSWVLRSARRAMAALHLVRPRTTVKGLASDVITVGGLASARVQVPAPGPFDANRGLNDQYNALRGFAVDVERRMTESAERLEKTIKDLSATHSAALDRVSSEIRDVRFRGFGLASLGVTLLLISVALELTGTFI